MFKKYTWIGQFHDQCQLYWLLKSNLWTTLTQKRTTFECTIDSPTVNNCIQSSFILHGSLGCRLGLNKFLGNQNVQWLKKGQWLHIESCTSGPVFSYKLRYIVGFWLVEMAISTNQKPTIYRNLYENTGPVIDSTHRSWGVSHGGVGGGGGSYDGRGHPWSIQEY